MKTSRRTTKMRDFLSPFDLLRSAQDWFSKTEKSSGFRPYLIFIILTFGFGITLLRFFSSLPFAGLVGLSLIVIPALSFIILYFIKAITDPDFCRSEQHVQKIFKMELETMGNEQHQLEGRIVEAEMLEHATDDPQPLLPDGNQASETGGKE